MSAQLACSHSAGYGEKDINGLTDHWPCTLQYIPNRQCTQYFNTAKNNYLFILPFLVSSTNINHAVVAFLHFFCSFCQGINHNINMKDCDPYQSNKETSPQNLLLCLLVTFTFFPQGNHSYFSLLQNFQCFFSFVICGTGFSLRPHHENQVLLAVHSTRRLRGSFFFSEYLFFQ